MLIIDLEYRKYSSRGGPHNLRGSVVGEEGLTVEEFVEYWYKRFSTMPTPQQYVDFQFSDCECVHCRAGRTRRGEKLNSSKQLTIRSVR